MIEWSDEQLREAGIDKRKLKALVKRLEDVGDRLKELNMEMYVAAGLCCLSHASRPTHSREGKADQESVVATVWNIPCDGGDW